VREALSLAVRGFWKLAGANSASVGLVFSTVVDARVMGSNHPIIINVCPLCEVVVVMVFWLPAVTRAPQTLLAMYVGGFAPFVAHSDSALPCSPHELASR